MTARYTEIRLKPSHCHRMRQPHEQPPQYREFSYSRRGRLILEKAEGNPFFVEEIMRTFIDRGAFLFDHGRWKVTANLQTTTIPDTIQGVIMARVDRLDEDLKQIIRTASVIGRAFLYRLLQAVTDAVKELDRHLDTLTLTELIREKQKLPELEYIFKHALVQELDL